MKWWTWVLAFLLALAAALGVAYLNRATVLGMIAHARLPHIAPNQPVTWLLKQRQRSRLSAATPP